MSLRIFLEYSFPWTPLSWVFLALYTKAPFSLCSIDIGFPDTTFHRVMLVARVWFFLTVFCTGYFFLLCFFLSSFFLIFCFWQISLCSSEQSQTLHLPVSALLGCGDFRHMLPCPTLFSALSGFHSSVNPQANVIYFVFLILDSSHISFSKLYVGAWQVTQNFAVLKHKIVMWARSWVQLSLDCHVVIVIWRLRMCVEGEVNVEGPILVY